MHNAENDTYVHDSILYFRKHPHPTKMSGDNGGADRYPTLQDVADMHVNVCVCACARNFNDVMIYQRSIA